MTQVVRSTSATTLAARVSPQRGSNQVVREEQESIDYFRELAREGALAGTYAAATSDVRRQLTRAAMAVATPVVYTHLTRAVEIRRGHLVCAAGITRLGEGCIDSFYDDLEAVAFDVLHSTKSITNVEGWMVGRIRAATVDAHRRRRGAIGAMQRPRLPGWLKQGLREDPWLSQLAVEILTWVGVRATAGRSMWPLDGWADRRAAFFGAPNSNDARAVEREVEQVLSVMRTRPDWYEKYVERPLGAKPAPVVTVAAAGGRGVDEFMPLSFVTAEDVIDAKLHEAASAALDAIERQIRNGIDMTSAVQTVLVRLFASATVAQELQSGPHGSTTADECLVRLTADPEELARLVQVVRDILGFER